MKIRNRSPRFVLVAASAAVAALLVSAAAPAHDAKAHANRVAPSAKAGSVDYTRSVRNYVVPDVTLTNADGRTVRLRDLLATGDPVLLNFIFTTCGAICPVMSKVFSEVPGQLAKGTPLRMVSISIDPENDTPAELKSYGKKFGANARWQFLTGRVEDVKTVQRAFDNYRGDKMSHEPLTLFRPAAGKAWVRIDGFASAEALAAEVLQAVPQ